MRHMVMSVLLLLAPVACGDNDVGEGDDNPVPDGYVRFETPPVRIAPGESIQYKTWVADPVDYERDILDVRGGQGLGGHHAILLGSTELQPVGTNRMWAVLDQLDTRFLGGVGGADGDQINLPEGAIFRVPAGVALVLQTHYQNAGDRDIEETSSYVDVKFAEPSADRIVAGLFATTARTLSIPPGQSAFDLRCTFEEDLPILMWVNHTHERATSIRTTLSLDGEEMVLKDDPAWNPDWATNANFERFAVDAPFVIPAGSTLTTHCAWDNETGRELTYPEEMCSFTGFTRLDGRTVLCVDGNVLTL
jgi:hypothetical protein